MTDFPKQNKAHEIFLDKAITTLFYILGVTVAIVGALVVGALMIARV